MDKKIVKKDIRNYLIEEIKCIAKKDSKKKLKVYDEYIDNEYDIALNLLIYRTLSRHIQKNLTEYLGIERSTYSKYETGASDISSFTLLKISNFLEVDIELFFKKNNLIEDYYKKLEEEGITC